MATAHPPHPPTAGTNGPSFADRLMASIERTGCFGCVGLDPVLEKLPEEVRKNRRNPAKAIGEFCDGVLQAVAGTVPAVKFQSACFERYGAEGIAELHECIVHAKSLDLLVILDAKRGDIGISAEHYNAAAFEGEAAADALTVNPYLGPDTLEPYLKGGVEKGKGLFVLVRTSNPGSDVVQNQVLKDGRTVAEMMAAMVHEIGRASENGRGLSAVGAVVGATKHTEAAALRKKMPSQVFLIPGYGAQGGTADDVKVMMRPGKTMGERGVLVTASRSVIYPMWTSKGSWTVDIRHAAQKLRTELAQIHT